MILFHRWWWETDNWKVFYRKCFLFLRSLNTVVFVFTKFWYARFLFQLINPFVVMETEFLTWLYYWDEILHLRVSFNISFLFYKKKCEESGKILYFCQHCSQPDGDDTMHLLLLMKPYWHMVVNCSVSSLLIHALFFRLGVLLPRCHIKCDCYASWDCLG